LEWLGCPGALSSCSVHAGIPRDCVQPGGEACTGTPVARCAHHLQPRLLEDVLRSRPVLRPPQDEGEHRRPVPSHQLRERPGITPLEPAHQVLVGGRVLGRVDAASAGAPSMPLKRRGLGKDLRLLRSLAARLLGCHGRERAGGAEGICSTGTPCGAWGTKSAASGCSPRWRSVYWSATLPAPTKEMLRGNGAPRTSSKPSKVSVYSPGPSGWLRTRRCRVGSTHSSCVRPSDLSVTRKTLCSGSTTSVGDGSASRGARPSNIATS